MYTSNIILYKGFVENAFSNLEWLGLAFLAFVLGFGLGVAWWEYIKPVEKVYGGSSRDGLDIPVPDRPGSLSSALGSRTDWYRYPGSGGENHLGDRDTGSGSGVDKNRLASGGH